MNIPGLSTSSEGIQRAMEAMNVAQSNIASSHPTDVSMAKDVVKMKLASHAVKANAAVLRVTHEMVEHVIDILA